MDPASAVAEAAHTRLAEALAVRPEALLGTKAEE
jgi:hypothetical protein